jgi:hypothetical protein
MESPTEAGPKGRERNPSQRVAEHEAKTRKKVEGLFERQPIRLEGREPPLALILSLVTRVTVLPRAI